MLPQYIKDLDQVMCMPFTLLSLYYHVVNVNLHRFTDQILEHTGDHPLISSPRILEPKDITV